MRNGSTSVLVAIVAVIVAGLGCITLLGIFQPSIDRGLVTQILGIITVAVPALLAYLKSEKAAATSEANADAIAQVHQRTEITDRHVTAARQELAVNTAVTAATAEKMGVDTNGVKL